MDIPEQFKPYERVISYFSQGYSISEVAKICGCPLSVLSGLIEQPGFKELIAEAQAEQAENFKEEEIIDNRYLSVEHKILTAISESLASAELRDLTRALEVVGNRQDKRARTKAGLPSTPQQGITLNTLNQNITLQMPAAFAPAIAAERNSNNEIIAVNGRSLAPLPNKAVVSLFSTLTSNKKEDRKELVNA